jgi:hypothetical protein
MGTHGQEPRGNTQQKFLQEECEKRVEEIDSKRTDVPSHDWLKQLQQNLYTASQGRQIPFRNDCGIVMPISSP